MFVSMALLVDRNLSIQIIDINPLDTVHSLNRTLDNFRPTI